MSWSCPLKIITGRREFVSGFTGSCSIHQFKVYIASSSRVLLQFFQRLALIRKNEALLWMDGRYFFQAGQELSAEWKLMRIGEDPAVDIWMADNLPKEASIGVDPWCISIDTAQRWEVCFCQKASEAGSNHKRFGRSVADKLKDVRKKPVQEQAQDSIFSFFRMVYSYLKEVHNKFFQNGLFVPLLEVFQKCLGIIFTAIDEVAWLYNIRGSDVAYCSIVHAFSIVTSNSAFIYVGMRKVSVEVTVSSDVTLLATDELDTVSTAKVDLAETEVRKITSETDKSVNGEHKAEENSNDLIWADPKKCCYALYAKLNPDKVLLQQSPLALAKALKVVSLNSVELDGLKKAHIRDGAAVVQYLVWLDKKMQDIYGASGYFLEKDSVKKEKHFWKAITQLANHGMLFVPAGKLLITCCDSKKKNPSKETEKTELYKMEDTLSALRSLMLSQSPPLDALVVPSEDYHQSEYVSARDKRREFVSGFTGSAGLALITKNEALLWTDGRYFLQAEQELSAQWKLMRIGEDPAVDIWMADNLPKEASIGVDPWCISIDTAQRWERAFAEKQQKLVPTSKNLVDEVWINRPQPQINAVIVHPLKFAGRSVADKLKDLRKKLVHEQARGIIFTALDEVAWLYNIRGSDVAYCPVVHAFAIVTSNSAFIYVDKRKVSVEVQAHLVENGIEIREYTAVSSDTTLLATDELDSVSTAKVALAETEVRKIPNETAKHANGEHQAEENSNDLIWADPGSCCYALYAKLNPDTVLLHQSPLALAKALKNSVELDGLKKAHIRDGAAVVQYLVWLDKKMQDILGASGYFLENDSVKKEKHLQSLKLTEVTVSDQLEGFRASKEHFRGLSFPTISSVGPNAAIIHYSPKAETCAELDPDKIYLFDSGAQYLDGTTDITRTVHFGKPSTHEKACYTAVLKGHIALGNARFPNGTNGHSLDILARIPLWKDGLDYRHGTGHGIGSYLNVHEGPHLISFRPQARNVPLQSSMTVTDEPGYYEDGEFGIRLENVLIVKEAGTNFNFGDRGYLSFEHITWAPYQTKLIDLNLLCPEEIDWLNSYHSTCRDILAPYLNEVENAWLKKATEPVAWSIDDDDGAGVFPLKQKYHVIGVCKGLVCLIAKTREDSTTFSVRFYNSATRFSYEHLKISHWILMYGNREVMLMGDKSELELVLYSGRDDKVKPMMLVANISEWEHVLLLLCNVTSNYVQSLVLPYHV
ncbi:Aminopeptidase P1 [Glycine soja]